MKDLIDFIKEEHRSLLCLFEQKFSAVKKNHDWQSFIDEIEKTFELNHHKKEEDYLFNEIKNYNQISAGGPFCTFYFDSHLQAPSLKSTLKLIKDLTSQDYRPQWDNKISEIIKSNSPLTIPCEDHESGRIIIRVARDLINYIKIENTNSVYLESHVAIESKLVSLFEHYIFVQINHFEREENCFLVMCKNLLPPQKWEQINQNIQRNFSIISL